MTKESIHNCVFGDWTYNPETGKDERTCKITNYKEVREHIHRDYKFAGCDESVENWVCVCGDVKQVSHNMTTTPEYNKETNMEVYRCLNKGCNHKIETLHINHKNVKSNNDEYEIDTCSVCGQVNKQKHKFPAVPVYDSKTNMEIYKCENPECGYVIRKPHTHTFGEITKTDEEFEYRYCTLDNTEQKTLHKFSDFTYDGITNTEIYECTNEGCNYVIKKPHVHKFGDILRTDENYEYRYCEVDGEEQKTPHSFPEIGKYDKASNMEIYGCENPDCGYVLKKEHTVHNFVRTNDKTNEIDICKICGFEKTNPHHFDLGTPEGDGLVRYKCENDGCDYSYTEERPHEHVLITDYENVGTEEVCRVAITHCQNCEYEASRVEIKDHEKHEVTVRYIGTENECKAVADKCNNCTYESEERIVSEHNWGPLQEGFFQDTQQCLDCSYKKVIPKSINNKETKQSIAKVEDVSNESDKVTKIESTENKDSSSKVEQTKAESTITQEVKENKETTQVEEQPITEQTATQEVKVEKEPVKQEESTQPEVKEPIKEIDPVESKPEKRKVVEVERLDSVKQDPVDEDIEIGRQRVRE